MIKIGSLFSGIGGFELGLERAIPNSTTLWQVEQVPFCQQILAKHWPNATIHNDVRTVGAHNLQPVDIICGGFPCQDISTAGLQRGIIKDETRSGLWWEMWRIISEIRPRIAIMENVSNIIRLGGLEVLGSIADIGYNVEWNIISAAQCGAPHERKRWFAIAYPNGIGRCQAKHGGIIPTNGKQSQIQPRRPSQQNIVGNQIRTRQITNPNGTFTKTNCGPNGIYTQHPNVNCNGQPATYWQQTQPPKPTICKLDDGISGGMDRSTWRTMRRIEKEQLKALGNAIVPQCSEWIGQRIMAAGLLDDLLT